MKKKIVYVVGTRPEIIRSAFIIKKLKQDQNINFKLLHTGQHYSYLLDKVFIEELEVPPPDINLKVGSNNHIQQLCNIMLEAEKFLNQFKPDMVCVFGDTNSSLAVGLTSAKMHISLTHVEAGFREWEMDLPEEINRRLIDHCANLLIALSDTQVNNLKAENILGDIYNTGDPQYEVFDFYYKKALKIDLLDKMALKKDQFILLTLHRDKNVDYVKRLLPILKALNKTLPVIFPIHPRTKKRLENYNPNYSKNLSNILFIDPLSYIPLLHIMDNAKLVVTDSGGLQKEAFWVKKPCVTLRKHTGWIETVKFGVNFLVDPDSKQISQAITFVLNHKDQITQKFQNIKNPYFKKNISENIVKLIKQYAGKPW